MASKTARGGGLVLFLWLLCACGAALGKDTRPQNVIAQLKHDLLVKNRYDKAVRPVWDIATPTTVYASLNIYYLTSLDPSTQTLTIQSWMSLQWMDEFLRWDPYKYAGLDVLFLSPTEIWTPDIALYNNAEADNFLDRPSSLAIVGHNGSVIWVPPMTQKTICNMNLKNFPLDVQVCNLTFGSWVHDMSKIDLKVSSEGFTRLDYYSPNSEWQIQKWEDIYEARQYNCCAGAFYPCITSRLYLQRRPTLHYYTIILPSAMTALLTLAIFWLSPTSSKRVIFGGINLIILTVLLSCIGKQIRSSAELPYAVMYVSATIFMTSLAIILSIVVKNMTYLAQVVSPPRFFVDLFSGPLRYILFLFPTPSAGNDLHQQANAFNIPLPPNAKKFGGGPASVTSSEQEWTIVALVTDRCLFLVYAVVLASLYVA